MLIFNGETTLDVTPKAYEVIYKDHGYTVQTETEEETKEEIKEEIKEETKQPEAPKAPTKKSAKAKAGE